MDKRILKLFKSIKNFKICDSLIVFGSAAQSKKYRDLDLILYRQKTWTPKELIKAINFMFKIQSKFPEFRLSFSSGNPNKDGKGLIINMVFEDNIMLSRNKIFAFLVGKEGKVIFGNNPYRKFKKIGDEYILFGINTTKNKIGYEKTKALVIIGLAFKGLVSKKQMRAKLFTKNYNCPEILEDLKSILSEKKVNKSKFHKVNNALYNKIKDEIYRKNPNIKKLSKIETNKRQMVLVKTHQKLKRLWEKDDISTIKNELAKLENKYRLAEKIDLN